MSFLIKENELLEKYNETCDKVKKVTKKRFNSEPVYNLKYLKAKIKSYEGKVKTNFNNDKTPKKRSQCICLSVVLIDSVLKMDRNYYPEVRRM